MSEKRNRYRVKRFFLSPIYDFIKDSRSVGILLIVCTVVSLFLANSEAGAVYLSFWNWHLPRQTGTIHLPSTLTDFVNDALMAVFFFLVGMEIRREVLKGELASPKKAILPVAAAIGGMLAPAGIYFLWNIHSGFLHGWGIPMATDIAFSLGILSLLGKRVPVSLKILLTALAIIDDLGAVLAIAVFYTAAIQVSYLIAAGILFLLLLLCNRFRIRSLFCYWILGIGLWYCLLNSGVHATIAGVLLAFCIPFERLAKVEHRLHFPVNFIILPLFALANTAILLPHDVFHAFADPITYGVVSGLVIGKPLGIFIVSFLMVRFGLARLPEGLHWKHIFGMGLIAGIGFTMSIFITMLAFSDVEAQTTAKIAILLASLLSGVMGYFCLKRFLHKR